MNNRIVLSVLFVTLFAFITSGLHAQDFNEEMRRQLRENLRPDITPDMRQQQQSASPIRPLRHQQEQEFQRTPTNRASQWSDRFPETVEMPEVTLNLNLFDANKTQVERSVVDYSNHRVHPLSNAQCILWRSQAQSNGITLFSGDLDPVRAIQNIRFRRRQERIDLIFRELDLWMLARGQKVEEEK